MTDASREDINDATLRLIKDMHERYHEESMSVVYAACLQIVHQIVTTSTDPRWKAIYRETLVSIVEDIEQTPILH